AGVLLRDRRPAVMVPRPVAVTLAAAAPGQRRRRRRGVPGVGGCRGRPGRLGQFRLHRAARGLSAHRPQLHAPAVPVGGVAAAPAAAAGGDAAGVAGRPADASEWVRAAVGRARPAAASGAALLGLAERADLEPDDRARAAAELPTVPGGCRPGGHGLARLADRETAVAAAPGEPGAGAGG